MTKIVVVGSDYCQFCCKVADYFKKNNIPFEYIDSETPVGAENRKDLSAKYKWKTVPMVFVNDEFVGGCDDFFSKLGKGQVKL